MSQSARRNTTITVLVLAVLIAFGLRFDHPRGGLANALGPAKTTIAVYLHGHEYKNGDKIIAKSEVKGASPAVVVIVNVGPDFYDVQNEKILERVKKKDVQGKLLAIIPFLGFPFQIIGL
jgi:hypothetical protein